MLGIHKFKQHRQRATFLILSFLMITFYQNCDGLSTQTQSTASSSNSGQSSGGGTTVTPPPPPPPPPGGTIDPAVRLAACKAVNGKPSFTSISLSQVTITSGAGNGAGDAAASPIALGVNNGVTDAATATAYSCNFATNLKCEIADPATNPYSLSSAVDSSGTDIGAGATAAQKQAILAASFGIGNGACSGAVNNGSKNVTLNPNRNAGNGEVYRCVQGSVRLKLTVETQIDNNNKNASDPSYITVNLQSGCWKESRLKNPAGDFGKFVNFGAATAVDGAWAAAIAPRDNSATLATVGSVYMFQQSGGVWNYSQKIMISDAAAGDSLTSIAIKGSKMVISSEKRGNHGAVFLYTLSGSTWSQAQVINPPMNQDAQKFGESLAMTDTSLVVGAPEYSISGAANNDKGGAVYVFSCAASSCTYRYSILSPDAGRGFGSSVALDGNTLVVGAPQALTLEADGKGFAEVFDIGGAATLVKQLVPADGAVGMKYGASVATLSGKILVGAPNKTVGTTNQAGGTYYYATYATSAVLKSGTEATGNFGRSVAFSSKGYIVGCPFCNAGSGTVSFINQVGGSDYKVLGLNASNNDGFGFSVAASGSSLVVGAYVKSDPNANSGAGYIYTMP